MAKHAIEMTEELRDLETRWKEAREVEVKWNAYRQEIQALLVEKLGGTEQFEEWLSQGASMSTSVDLGLLDLTIGKEAVADKAKLAAIAKKFPEALGTVLVYEVKPVNMTAFKAAAEQKTELGRALKRAISFRMKAPAFKAKKEDAE